MLAKITKAFWIFAITVLLLVIFLPGYTKVRELRDRNDDLGARIEQLKLENLRLQEELKKAQNDPLYQEKIAREKMGVVRKGEIPVIIIPEEK